MNTQEIHKKYKVTKQYIHIHNNNLHSVVNLEVHTSNSI